MESMAAACKKSAIMEMEYFLKTLSFVPDGKLTWSPSPTAKSALRIAAHTAIYAEVFAQIIRTGKWFQGDLAEWIAARAAAEEAIKTREEAIALFRKNTDEVTAALDALTPELIESTIATPGLSAPMTFFMNLPTLHAQAHAAQIDYLQTCWGDQEVHL